MPQVRSACENVGFFYAAGHGIDDGIVDRAFAASRRFHALSMEEKLALRLNDWNIGYLPMNASVAGAGWPRSTALQPWVAAPVIVATIAARQAPPPTTRPAAAPARVS